jgi:hypothetical protein
MHKDWRDDEAEAVIKAYFRGDKEAADFVTDCLEQEGLTHDALVSLSPFQ